MASRYWLLKSEPETYSFERLLKEKKTNWDGVRNFQARNFLREIKKDDVALIYHSGGDKAVVGVAKCVREGYADIDAEDGSEWVQVDIAAVKPLPHRVPLSTIKGTPALAEIPLIRQSRLSVMPITKAHYEVLVKLGEKPAPVGKKK